ncbi:TIR domain-containing protein [bacterium]|nr:TIR domain-containing protein [bacterium]
MAHDVFVSYSSKDKAVADTIVASLENNGIRCWYAPRDIKPGDDWGTAITDAIETCRVFLMIFSSNANHSQRVLDELNYAVSQESIILPFRIENLTPKGAMMLHLSSRHWLDAYDPSWEYYIKKLVQTVSINLNKKITSDFDKVPEDVIEKEPSRGKNHLLWIIFRIFIGIVLVVGSWLGYKLFFRNQEAINSTDADESSCRLAFQGSNFGGEGIGILTSDLSGENQKQLTGISGPDKVYPVWSPDGLKIAYFSREFYNRELTLFIMDTNGSNNIEIAADLVARDFQGFIASPASWAPDGSKLSFGSNHDGISDIFVVNADGTGLVQLITNDTDDYFPVWSPDGEHIAYLSASIDGDIYLSVMDIDGNNKKQLVKHGYSPAWSPDSSKIAYYSENKYLAMINSDGSGQEKILAPNTFLETVPIGKPHLSWSPDGRQIAFETDVRGNLDIYILRVGEDESLRTLTNNVSDDYQPSWSPDGSWIAFYSDRVIGDNSARKLMLVNPLGNNMKNLFAGIGFLEAGPTWSPSCKN